MKPFQSLLFLAVIILIGGVAALWWGKSIQDATAPVEVVDDLVAEPVEEELDLGSYLIFQSVSTTDAGTQDWVNDDTDTYTFYRLALGEATYWENPSSRDLEAFASIEHGPEFSGSLIASVYGTELLLHRYETDRVFDPLTGSSEQGKEQDAVMSLNGEIVEIRSENWSMFRSHNGRYEVRYEFGGTEGGDVGTFEVVDVSSGARLALHKITLDSGEVGNPEPFMIDNSGTYLYAHQTCGCEATLSGLWLVDVQTGKSTRLDELVDLDSWFLSTLDAEGRELLTISTDREPSQDGPYDELLPPTTIWILDLDSLEAEELLVDEKSAWDRPWVDPEGNDRYVVRLWDAGNKLYLMGFDDTEIADKNFLADGWVLDWVGDWLVVHNRQDSTLKLVNVESKEEAILEIPGERVDYVGSIELE